MKSFFRRFMLHHPAQSSWLSYIVGMRFARAGAVKVATQHPARCFRDASKTTKEIWTRPEFLHSASPRASLIEPVQSNRPFVDLCCNMLDGFILYIKEELQHLGTTLKIRALGQHAHYIEARNGILRATMHYLDSDFKRSNIEVSFTRLLAEAVFCH